MKVALQSGFTLSLLVLVRVHAMAFGNLSHPANGQQ